MSLHKCPNCKEIGFFWSVDHEITSLTIWNCSICGYHALEDESFESTCPDCNYAYRLLMKKEDSEYWWCSKCARKTIIK